MMLLQMGMHDEQMDGQPKHEQTEDQWSLEAVSTESHHIRVFLAERCQKFHHLALNILQQTDLRLDATESQANDTKWCNANKQDALNSTSTNFG